MIYSPSSKQRTNGKKEMKDNLLDLDFGGAQEKIDLKFLDNHIHFINGEIDEDNVGDAIRWIIYENLDKNKPKQLQLYINSTGGNLYDAFALIDIMKRSQYPIRTVGIGSIMSAAFLIFASGQKGGRYIAPNTGIMCHQFSNEQEGKYHDIKAQVKENENCNARMVNILREATGLDTRTIKSKFLPASDVWLTAEELIELKVADHIL